MDKGKIRIPENNLRKGTERLFEINKLIPYLGIEDGGSDRNDRKGINKYEYMILSRNGETNENA